MRLHEMLLILKIPSELLWTSVSFRYEVLCLPSARPSSPTPACTCPRAPSPASWFPAGAMASRVLRAPLPAFSRPAPPSRLLPKHPRALKLLHIRSWKSGARWLAPTRCALFCSTQSPSCICLHLSKACAPPPITCTQLLHLL
jgi:hypothetical protein